MTEEAETAVANSINFEAVKTSMSQNKDGTILRVAIHPNEVPPSLHTDWVGTRYMVVMVRLNDDDTPHVDQDKEHITRLIQSAGMLCRNSDFWTFMESSNEKECTEALRDRLGIKSRSEFNANAKARTLFEGIRQEFTDTKGKL